jgi:hypothetical protein
MDYESLIQYVNKKVRLTLINNFWYRAKIISVSEKAITFIEAKGHSVSVSPSAILLIEEVSE